MCFHMVAHSRHTEALRAAQLPSIPYLGVHVQDLTFMDENPDQANGMINFHKNRLLYTAISELMRCQQVSYNYTPLMALQSSMRSIATMDLNKLYQVSLVREPRDGHQSTSSSSDDSGKKGKTLSIAIAKMTTKVIEELERSDPH